MKTVCFDVYHNGREWVAKNNRLVVSGKTMEELDRNLKNKLGSMFRGKVKKVKVTMELDYRKNLPHWMWQYHPYYFYRTIVFDLD